jgi:leader peptidase (prepilin peptidase)/N-methyltransferase
MATSLYLWINPPSKLGYPLGFILILYFGTVFVIDMEHRLILHPTSLFGSLLGLLVGTLAHGIYPTLLGGLGGFVIMLVLYYVGVLFTRFRLRKLEASGQPTDDEEALGAGDVILTTIIGLMLGWPLIWFGILVAVLLGGAFSILFLLSLVLTRKYQKNALMIFLPYGPYLIASAFWIMFFPKSLAALVP